MRVALDTNRYRDLVDGDAGAVATLEAADSIVLPFVVLAELRAGFAAGARAQKNEQALIRFLLKPGVEVIYADDGTTRVYATLFRQLGLQGTPLPTNDLWIAAIAIQHDLLLYTRDRHFRKLPQLPQI